MKTYPCNHPDCKNRPKNHKHIDVLTGKACLYPTTIQVSGYINDHGELIIQSSGPYSKRRERAMKMFSLTTETFGMRIETIVDDTQPTETVRLVPANVS